MAQGVATGRFRRLFPLRQKVPRGIRLIAKDLYRVGRRVDEGHQTVLFVVGCQRSGTTLLTLIFERDYNAKVYGEFSSLSSFDIETGLRLNPLDDVKHTIETSGYPLVITKPLVETHRLPELLAHFPGSRAIWIYRDYRDVASSDLVEFGRENGINNIRPIVDGDAHNWRSEGASPETRRLLAGYFSDDMCEGDAAALFWYARNSLFFDLSLADNPSVMMIRYEELVSRPAEIIRDVYDFVGHEFPGTDLLKGVTRKSVGKGRSLTLSPGVGTLCTSMLQRLEDAYAARSQVSGLTGR